MIEDNDGYGPDRRAWGPSFTQARDREPHPSLAFYMGVPEHREKSWVAPELREVPTVKTCPTHNTWNPPGTPWARTYAINYFSTGSAFHQGRERGDERWSMPIDNFSASEQSLFMDNLRPYYSYNLASFVSELYDGSFPHNGQMNAVFLDGHVESIERNWALQNLNVNSHPFWWEDF